MSYITTGFISGHDLTKETFHTNSCSLHTFPHNAASTSKPTSLLPMTEMPHFLQPVISLIKGEKSIKISSNRGHQKSIAIFMKNERCIK